MGWTTLWVDVERGLPAVCLKCGKRKRIVRRSERLVAATATEGVGAVGAACGVMVARAMREDPAMAAIVLGGSVLGSIGVALFMQSRAPKVTLALPLCRACNERWRAGLRVRHGIWAGLAAALLSLGWAFFGREPLGYWIGGAFFVLSLAVAVVARLRDRFVYAASIQGSRAELKGVSDAARAAIEAKRLAKPSAVSS